MTIADLRYRFDTILRGRGYAADAELFQELLDELVEATTQYAPSPDLEARS